MDVSEDIFAAEKSYAKLAERYASAATFGNATDKMLFDLVRINALISVLERNQTKYQRRKVSTTELTTVPFSSLTRRNNSLFLDLSTPHCVDVELRPCLSDDEVCKVAEELKVLCYSI